MLFSLRLIVNAYVPGNTLNKQTDITIVAQRFLGISNHYTNNCIARHIHYPYICTISHLTLIERIVLCLNLEEIKQKNCQIIKASLIHAELWTPCCLCEQ